MTNRISQGGDTVNKQVLLKGSAVLTADTGETAAKDTVVSDLISSASWAELTTREYQDILQHRKRWSNVLLSLVSLIIVMDFVIMILTGTNALSFTSSLAVPAFIGSSILEIFGLSYIVVRYLFPGDTLPDSKVKE